VAQIQPEPNYDHRLAERVVAYLQTNDHRLFSFTQHFTPAQRRAFARDLREGLGEITDSGSARKTSATGFLMSDGRLHRIVREWAMARGAWPRGADPQTPVTSLGSIADEDSLPSSNDELRRPGRL
jgi:hypothetical protein